MACHDEQYAPLGNIRTYTCKGFERQEWKPGYQHDEPRYRRPGRSNIIFTCRFLESGFHLSLKRTISVAYLVLYIDFLHLSFGDISWCDFSLLLARQCLSSRSLCHGDCVAINAVYQPPFVQDPKAADRSKIMAHTSHQGTSREHKDDQIVGMGTQMGADHHGMYT